MKHTVFKRDTLSSHRRGYGSDLSYRIFNRTCSWDPDLKGNSPVAMVAACVCPLIRLGLNRIEATPSQEGVVRGPRFCRDSLGFQRTGRLSEQLDHPFNTPIGQRIPLLHPLLEQPLIGWTLRNGVFDQSFAPIAAPLAVKRKVVKHQGEQIIFMSAG